MYRIYCTYCILIITYILYLFLPIVCVCNRLYVIPTRRLNDVTRLVARVDHRRPMCTRLSLVSITADLCVP